MSDHPNEIDEESGEIPPISPAGRRGKILAAWLFLLVIVVFLILFIVSYNERNQPLRSIFGWQAEYGQAAGTG